MMSWKKLQIMCVSDYREWLLKKTVQKLSVKLLWKVIPKGRTEISGYQFYLIFISTMHLSEVFCVIS